MTQPAALVLICALAVCLPGAEPAPRLPEEAAATVQETMVCTIRRVDAQAGRLEVLTGVGLAVRVERVRVYPTIWILVDGVVGRLSDLRPGQLVRIEYRRTAEGMVAGKVETIRLPDAGGRP